MRTAGTVHYGCQSIERASPSQLGIERAVGFRIAVGIADLRALLVAVQGRMSIQSQWRIAAAGAAETAGLELHISDERFELDAEWVLAPVPHSRSIVRVVGLRQKLVFVVQRLQARN